MIKIDTRTEKKIHLTFELSPKMARILQVTFGLESLPATVVKSYREYNDEELSGIFMLIRDKIKEELGKDGEENK